MTRSSVVLIDGEHYPPVVARAIAKLKERDENPVLALLVGGGEKLDGEPSVGIPLQVAEDPERDLAEAIERTGAKRVIDISDEPVLGYLARFRLASVALWKGASYIGADFELNPPSRELAPSVPSVAVIGTGKRTGKTAVGGATARAFRDAGLNPVVVAMGRGGPPEPELIEADALLAPETLLEWSEAGRHAASDYIEDALVAGVPTVGAWRAGGGLAGEPSFTNYETAVRRAEEMEPGTLILEGSGAAIPPTRFDAAILVADAAIDPAFLCGYLGLYRVLLADLVVLTMVEEPVDQRRLAEVEDCLRSSLNKPKVLRTVFRPHPLGEVSGQ
ncbi:MAG: 2,3-diphosphoglycerate synthetase, partial [Actinomycetota bacterium]